MTDSRISELYDELFDAVQLVIHYLAGIKNDLAEDKYSYDDAQKDFEYFSTGFEVENILKAIIDEHARTELDKTTELPVISPDAPVDVWAHFGGVNHGV